MIAWLIALLGIIPNIVTLANDSKHLVTLDIVLKFPGVVYLIHSDLVRNSQRPAVIVQEEAASERVQISKSETPKIYCQNYCIVDSIFTFFVHSNVFRCFPEQYLAGSSRQCLCPVGNDADPAELAYESSALLFQNQRFRNETLELIRMSKPPVVRPKAVPVDLTPGQKKSKLEESSCDSAKLRSPFRARSVSCSRIRTRGAVVSQDTSV